MWALLDIVEPGNVSKNSLLEKGLEPSTNGLQNRRSTIELLQPIVPS